MHDTLTNRQTAKLSQKGLHRTIPRDKKPKLFRREVSQEALDIIQLRRSQVQVQNASKEKESQEPFQTAVEQTSTQGLEGPRGMANRCSGRGRCEVRL